MKQIYKKTPMPKRDFNKIALQLYWNNTSVWVFCKFAAIFRTLLPKNMYGGLLLAYGLYFVYSRIQSIVDLLEKF